MKKVMLLGSGELGRELTISLKRLGCEVIAVDNYAWDLKGQAPAQQVADKSVDCDMLNGNMLRTVIDWHEVDVIVPEIEAIDTDTLLQCENDGYHVVPSGFAVDKTMNRDRIRDFATEIGMTTAKYDYAKSLKQLQKAYENMDSKVVIKPVMSSSGKGQSIVERDDLVGCHSAWHYAIENMRGSRPKVIIEEFIDFDYEITLLTIRSKYQTHFCDPIIHIQKDGDFKFSQQFESNNIWQLHPSGQLVMADSIKRMIQSAQLQAEIITTELGGDGLFGVEFFVKDGRPIFSELSPRPHDTGLVTLKSQNYSQFDLHARAILGLPIPEITTKQSTQVHTINAEKQSRNFKIHLDQIQSDVDVHLFNKPETRANRRMGVVFSNDPQAGRNAVNNIEITYEE